MKPFFLPMIISLLCSPVSQAEGFGARVEPLLGFSSSDTGIQLQVESGGCTTAESFEVNKYTYRKTIRIFFIRVVPDVCLALLRDGETVNYSFEALGLKAGDHFQIMNQIQVR